jgi:hypothetical protein
MGRPSPMLDGFKPDRIAHFTNAEIDAFLASADMGNAG